MKNNLQQLIAQGKTKQAIQELLKVTEQLGDKDLQEEVVLQSARFEHYSHDKRLGTTAFTEQGVSIGKINKALLYIVSQLPKEHTGEKKEVTNPKITKQKKWIVLVTFLAILAVSVGIWKSTDLKQGSSGSHEVTYEASSLSIDAKTNKGTDNLIFKSGETIRIYYKVSQPCLMRVIYKLADGRLILFKNDMEISKNEVGKYIELGNGYEVASPFGQENLFFFVQNDPFPPLMTELSDDGYPVIKAELAESLKRTRGLKQKKHFAEYELVLSTHN